MKTKGLIVKLFIIVLFCFVDCTRAQNMKMDNQKQNEIKTEYIVVPSTYRNADIPVYVTVQKDYSSSKNYPMLMMFHGHGGNHNENGGFDIVANTMAQNGFIVVTIDFPGCGKSTESFLLNIMTNMKHDVIDVYNNIVTSYSVDESNICGLGYSMGGRIVLEILAENKIRFNAITLVAPAEDLDDLKTLFGGEEVYEQKRAIAVKTGSVKNNNEYLSKEWFFDLEKNADGLVEKAALNYKNPSFVICAKNDIVVHSFVSENVANVLGSKLLKLNKGGHAYSFHSENPEVIDTVNNAIIKWLLNYNAQ